MQEKELDQTHLSALGVQQYTIKRYINASFIHSLPELRTHKPCSMLIGQSPSPVVGGAYKHHNITKNSTLFEILFMINGEYNKGVGEFLSLWGGCVHKYQVKVNFT